MRKRSTVLAVFAALLAAATAHAAPAERIPFSTTVPLPTGTYHFRFSLWDANGVAAPGLMVWSEEKRLAVKGVAAGSAYRAPLRHTLGSVNRFSAPLKPPYPPVDFSRQLWVQVAYRTAPTRPWRAVKKRTPLAMAPYALWSGRAEAARDADTVDGKHASELGLQPHTHDGADVTAGTVAEARIDQAIARDEELEEHVQRTDNPHQVTAAQAGAAAAQHTHGAADIVSGTVPFASLPTGTAADQVAVGDHAHDAAYPSQTSVNALETRIADLETANTSLQSRLAALEAANTAIAAVLEHFSHTEAGGIHTVVVSGANLQVVDGSGSTDGTVNGMGNVIVGYNALRGGGDVRSGSHNLVIGDQNNFSSFGGIVAGQLNSIASSYASVSGGALNTASGPSASVSGGAGNIASGAFSSVSGGGSNTASNVNSSVSGGDNNIASGSAASVSGGSSNFATGDSSSVSGGFANAATADSASVSGGSTHTTNGQYDWRAGGLFEDQ